MTVELKNGNVVVTIPHNDLKNLPETESRLSLSVASTGGNQAMPLVINGKQVVAKAGLNIFIPIPGRKKNKDGSVVDVKTGEILVPAS